GGDVVVPAGRKLRRASLSPDPGRHAFLQLILGETIDRKHAPGLVHHVDPTGAYVLAAGVDLGAPALENFTDLGKAAVLDCDVSEDPGTSLAVEHSAVSNHNIVGRITRGRRSGSRSRACRESNCCRKEQCFRHAAIIQRSPSPSEGCRDPSSESSSRSVASACQCARDWLADTLSDYQTRYLDPLSHPWTFYLRRCSNPR